MIIETGVSATMGNWTGCTRALEQILPFARRGATEAANSVSTFTRELARFGNEVESVLGVEVLAVSEQGGAEAMRPARGQPPGVSQRDCEQKQMCALPLNDS